MKNTNQEAKPHYRPSLAARIATGVTFATLTGSSLFAQGADLAELESIANASTAAHRILTERDIVITGRAQTLPYAYGVPDDDLELTAFYGNAPLVVGEAGGFDIFNAVDPADPKPGTGLVTSFDSGSFWERVTNNEPELVSGRFILGDHQTAYYLGRDANDSVDNDFAYIVNLKQPETSEIILHGSAADYTFVPVTPFTGTRGTAIFYDNGGVADMLGFIVDETDVPSSVYLYTDEMDTLSPIPSEPSGIDQFGGPDANMITNLTTDGLGNVYVVGASRERLQGSVGQGRLFAAKYNASGQRVWLRHFGASEDKDNQDFPFDIVHSDGFLFTAGRYYVRGGAQKEAFVAKLSAQTGAVVAEYVAAGPNVQFAGSITVDDKPDATGSVYIGGIWGPSTLSEIRERGIRPDPFVMKLRKSNLSVETVNFEVSDGLRELWGGLQYDDGKIYATGWTSGNADPEATSNRRTRGRDAWVGAFDAETLDTLWITQWGAFREQDWAWDVDVDAVGNLYVAGHSYGPITKSSEAGANLSGASSNEGNEGHLVKIEPGNGQILWVRQITSPASDSARSVSVAGNNVYVTGHTFGDLPAGNTVYADSDLWIAKYTLDGERLAIHQISTDREDRGFVAADAATGRVYVGGLTEGSLVRRNAGWLDAFLFEIDPDTLRIISSD